MSGESIYSMQEEGQALLSAKIKSPQQSSSKNSRATVFKTLGLVCAAMTLGFVGYSAGNQNRALTSDLSIKIGDGYGEFQIGLYQGDAKANVDCNVCAEEFASLGGCPYLLALDEAKINEIAKLITVAACSEAEHCFPAAAEKCGAPGLTLDGSDAPVEDEEKEQGAAPPAYAGYNGGAPVYKKEGFPVFNRAEHDFNGGDHSFNAGDHNFNLGAPILNKGNPTFNGGDPTFNGGAPVYKKEGFPVFNRAEHDFNAGSGKDNDVNFAFPAKI